MWIAEIKNPKNHKEREIKKSVESFVNIRHFHCCVIYLAIPNCLLADDSTRVFCMVGTIVICFVFSTSFLVFWSYPIPYILYRISLLQFFFFSLCISKFNSNNCEHLRWFVCCVAFNLHQRLVYLTTRSKWKKEH